MKKISLLFILLVIITLISACSSSFPDKTNSVSAAGNYVSVAEKSKVAQPSTERPSINSVTYVYNKNTHKFHYPSCSSVDDMKEKNKVFWYDSRDALIEKYPSAVPCKRCNP